ncbi:MULTISPECIES: type II toxin-antitoxin system VapC family toxin [unclassified Mesorhizobium]|uniref:type II toxin-antitoxin system VapC family toxin n=1 Tax=unclassified Mesorhizobium TaxID=325217 RepID=UPI003339D45A
MKLLLDTHLLLWAAGEPEKLPPAALAEIENADNHLTFSAATPWEIAIKRGLGRLDLKGRCASFRRGLIDNGYDKLPITGEHAIAVEGLPPIHKDPFDRILIAQSIVEGITLTVDDRVAQCPAPVRRL